MTDPSWWAIPCTDCPYLALDEQDLDTHQQDQHPAVASAWTDRLSLALAVLVGLFVVVALLLVVAWASPAQPGGPVRDSIRTGLLECQVWADVQHYRLGEPASAITQDPIPAQCLTEATR